MKLLLDEMYAPEIARQLRQQGHDVVSVKERPELIGASDEELLGLMAAEGRAIVTNNAIDFVPLVIGAALEGHDHAGVLLTSDRSLPRRQATIGRFVEVFGRLLRENPEDGSLANQMRWLP